ncbi:MAG TPA: glycosyl hydrolase [Lacunisphaera sp.]|nr:glycosyl hydrolase [Lacunisphaera sp.]
MRLRSAFVLLLGLAFAHLVPPAAAESARAAPDTTKPWTRWWWPGSAVDEASITRQLEQFAAAGLGGVEITPIYGVRGYEDRNITFLSARWIEMLAHTGREAKRLGLGVDMATGTGWPFGGPWIAPEDGSQKLALVEGKLAGTPTKMKVKRAAPGDEGLVVDPYSPAALGRYLAPFGAAFTGFPAGLVRAQFHDSFEYYESAWTPELINTFQALHGYDLQEHAAELLGQKPLEPAQLARLKGDYRATLAKLHLDYLQAWIKWSHDHGFIVRNQSHGAPANLLDLYGAVDIPETETFGSTRFPIPGLRQEWTSNRDLPDPLVLRFASSAAHVMGRPLASSETCTWLREHWQVALAFTKPEIDRLFTCGLNHLLYHGTVFSPKDAAWPGWLFYASTQFNPNNPWWDDFGALNAYVQRVQSVLQSGQADNDVLLYWPFDDVEHQADGLMKQYTVHDRSWLNGSAFERMAKELLQAGYGIDYISDRQLQSTRVDGGAFVAPGGGRYKALVIPATKFMPVATLAKLLALQQAGGAVIYEAPPDDVPGLGQLEERRAQFREIRNAIGMSGSRTGGVMARLEQTGAIREPIAGTGLGYIRRAQADGGHSYFLVNLTDMPFDGWLGLGTQTGAAVISDPLTGRSGAAPTGPAKKSMIYLQLAPGESLLVRTFASASAPAATAPAWHWTSPIAPALPLAGEWQVTFLKGGPELPPPFKASELKSWTELAGEPAQSFGGTARYQLVFNLTAKKGDDWLLDLGDVRESARVRLNGQDVGTVWSLPFRVRVGEYLKSGRNVLEVDVTNLAANRIRDLDRRKVDWKIMREINFVNIDYKPFDASGWPLTPSGLLGPVTLTPLKYLAP